MHRGAALHKWPQKIVQCVLGPDFWTLILFHLGGVGKVKGLRDKSDGRMRDGMRKWDRMRKRDVMGKEV